MTSKLNIKDVLEGLESEDLASKVKALSTISAVTEQTSKQIPREVIELLVKVLKTAEKKPLTMSCLNSILHLSKFDHLKTTITDFDAITIVCPCLNTHDSSIVKLALNVIIELAVGDKNLTSLINGGGIIPLIGMIQRDSKDYKKTATNLLTSIISSNVSELLFQDEIIQALFVLIQSPNEDTRSWILTQLNTLVSKNEELSLKLGEFGIVEHLIYLFSSSNQKNAELAFRTLEMMTRKHEHIKMFAGEFDSVEKILSIIRENKLDKRIVLKLLFNMTKELIEDKETITETGEVTIEKVTRRELLETKKCLMENNGIQLLLETVLITQEELVKQYCIDIIGNLVIQEFSIKILETTFEKKKLTDMLLEILIDPKSSDKLRNSVIETMSYFAEEEVCVKKLVELDVINKLLQMLKGKVLILVVVQLFARLNEHTSFQKQIFESKGLVPIVEMLSSTVEQEREGGLRALVPFCSTPNGRIVLQEMNVIDILKKLEKDESSQVQHLAKQTYKKIFKDGDSAFKLGLQNKGPYKFDFNEISRIDRDLVGKCQERIRKKIPKSKVRVQINWRQIERFEKKELMERCMGMLSNEEIWNELSSAIDLLTFNDEMSHVFDSEVKFILVDIDKESSVKLEDLTMIYTLPLNGEILTPKKIAGALSLELFGKDITEEMEDIDEKYQYAVEELKKVAKDSSIPTLGDINVLYLHLMLHAEKLYKDSFIDNQAMIICKKEILDPDEIFLKGWKVVKINANGFKQNRILLLTNWNFFSVSFDYKYKKIDYSHTKMHSLEDFDSVDIGVLKNKNQTDEELSFENRQYGFCIYEINKEIEQASETNISVSEDDFYKVKREEKKEDKSIIQSLTNSFLLRKKTEKTEKNEEKKEEHKSDDSHSFEEVDALTQTDNPDKVRDVDGLHRYVFSPSDDCIKSKQKPLVDEIAWSIWAAASANKRRNLALPFYQDLEKPEEGFASQIYNKMGWGVSSTKNLNKDISSSKNLNKDAKITSKNELALKPSQSSKKLLF